MGRLLADEETRIIGIDRLCQITVPIVVRQTSIFASNYFFFFLIIFCYFIATKPKLFAFTFSLYFFLPSTTIGQRKNTEILLFFLVIFKIYFYMSAPN